MSEEKASGGFVRGICFWVSLLVFVMISTGVLAQWEAWARYKKIYADTNTVKIVLDDDTEIDVQPGHYIKEFRVQRRVDIVEVSKKSKKIFYNPKKILVEKK